MEGKRVARLAVLIALALGLGWLESLIPLPPAMPPGIKLGLPNLVVVFTLYRAGGKDAAVVSLLRVALTSFSFGNAYSFAYSLAGAVLSLAVMALLRRFSGFSLVSVSIAGGVSHNMGQIFIAMAVLGTARVAFYLPVLLIAGLLTGACIGMVGGILLKRVPPL